MDLQRIVSELKSERDRVDRAIAALGVSALVDIGKVTPARRRRHRMTAAGRKRLSESVKRRWAAARRSGTALVGTSASVAPKKKRGGLTPAGRRKLSEMMKKRWAERRKKSS